MPRTRVAVLDDGLQRLAVQGLVDEADLLRQRLVEEDAADGGLDQLVVGAAVADADQRLQLQDAQVVGQDRLLEAAVDALRLDGRTRR